MNDDIGTLEPNYKTETIMRVQCTQNSSVSLDSPVRCCTFNT